VTPSKNMVPSFSAPSSSTHNMKNNFCHIVLAETTTNDLFLALLQSDIVYDLYMLIVNKLNFAKSSLSGVLNQRYLNLSFYDFTEVFCLTVLLLVYHHHHPCLFPSMVHKSLNLYERFDNILQPIVNLTSTCFKWCQIPDLQN